MPDSTAYQIGRTIGRLPRWTRLGLLLFLIVFLYRACATSSDAPIAAKTTATSKATNASVPPKVAQGPSKKDSCQANIDEGKAKYVALFKERKYWDAALAIRNCAEILDSPALQKLVREAEIASHLADINNPKASSFDRARAMQMLGRDYPDVGAKYENQAVKLLADSDHLAREDDKNRKRSEGVRVGISKEDVFASSWGKPESINTTTTAKGTREQWVYGGRSYLYFDDGVLIAIPN